VTGPDGENGTNTARSTHTARSTAPAFLVYAHCTYVRTAHSIARDGVRSPWCNPPSMASGPPDGVAKPRRLPRPFRRACYHGESACLLLSGAQVLLQCRAQRTRPLLVHRRVETIPVGPYEPAYDGRRSDYKVLYCTFEGGCVGKQAAQGAKRGNQDGVGAVFFLFDSNSEAPSMPLYFPSGRAPRPHQLHVSRFSRPPSPFHAFLSTSFSIFSLPVRFTRAQFSIRFFLRTSCRYRGSR
jgi:hypothetical protein